MRFSLSFVWVNKYSVIGMDIGMKISVFYEHILEAAQQEKKSPEAICEKVSSFGISGVEIENTRLMNEKEKVLNALKAGNLEISCMYGFFDFAHQSKEDALKAGMDMVNLADEFGIKKIMLIPGFLRKFEFLPIIYKKKVNQMVEVLRNICSYAKDKKIMVVLEDFDGKEAPFATSKQLHYFINAIDDLYCAFDTGNFLYSEENALEVLPLFLDKIGHVHCKDRSFEITEGETPKATVKGRNMYSCAVGSGVIAMKEIVKKIVDKGYDDYFAIEHFGSLHQLRDMEKSVYWLTEHLQ